MNSNPSQLLKKAEMVLSKSTLDGMKSESTFYDEAKLHNDLRHVKTSIIYILIECNTNTSKITTIINKIELIREETNKIPIYIVMYGFRGVKAETYEEIIKAKKFENLYVERKFKIQQSCIDIHYVYDYLNEYHSKLNHGNAYIIHFLFTDSCCDNINTILNFEYFYAFLLFRPTKHPFQDTPFVHTHLITPDFMNTCYQRFLLDDVRFSGVNKGGIQTWEIDELHHPIEECECLHGVFIDFIQNHCDRPTDANLTPGEINITDKPFGIGGLRTAFWGYNDLGESLIVKQFKKKDYQLFESYIDMVSIHMVCQDVANLFESYINMIFDYEKNPNDLTIDDLRHTQLSSFNQVTLSPQQVNARKKLKKIRFIPLRLFVELDRDDPIRKTSTRMHIDDIQRVCSKHNIFFIEEPLNGKFHKFNSNMDFVSYKHYSHTLQCFSHFSYFISAQQFVISDLQGIYDESNETYILTDPAVNHQYPSRFYFSLTNMGSSGIFNFFTKHICNECCKELYLPPHYLQRNDLYIDTSKQLHQV